ncbi:hypothetical protein LCGC14_0995690 [marine sediment metagenome]|uniref:Cytochrome c-type biogenesis protein CcmE n=1 Tax=marine sediment metagenome TaxID=412755 RepID=A0A0F9NQX9_9ZZZZ|nr:MAG: hypothetical protein Lokiarch_29770 [Candidatus Lokiarchaeum sp. GC14_75]
MVKFKKSKIIAVVAIVASIIIIISLISVNSRPYLRVSQVTASPTGYNNKEIQVIGIVQGFSGSDFNLTEGENAILIHTSGVTVPNDVDNGLEVVVTGIFNSSLILTASQILTQCS